MIIIVKFHVYIWKVIVLAISRVMCISCRRHVDIHKEFKGVSLMWTHVDRGSQKLDFLVDVING